MDYRFVVVLSVAVGVGLGSLIGAAMAQMPTTVTFKDNKTGEVISTATTWGGRTYVRNAQGKLIGSIAVDATGKLTNYDIHGKPLAQPLMPKRPHD